MMKNEGDLGTLNFLKELAERTSPVIFAYDIDAHRLVYVNSSFEEVWKKTRESVYENPASLLETIHPEDKCYVTKMYHKFLKEAESKDIGFRITLPDKSIRWLELTPLLIEQEMGNRLIAGFVADNTALKENEANVQKYAAKKDSVLEILSHDLSGPLLNIQGLSSLLSKEFKEYKNPKLDKLIEMIATTCERSVGMIREFVKQEFLESANAELIKERVNIVEVIRLLINQYKASEKDIAKKFDLFTSHEEIFVEVDEYKFSQVINNLISNSIKFTHDGGTIIVRIEDKKEAVLITLADNGIGIPAKYQEGLFEKFSKARRKGLKGEPSVGLGMSLIKTIVEWHGAEIWFESEENRGTTFYIQLPKEEMGDS